LIAIVAGGTTIYVLLTLQRVAAPTVRLSVTVATVALVALVALTALMRVIVFPLTMHDVIVLFTIPIGLAAASSTVAAAIGLSDSNGDLLRHRRELADMLRSCTDDRLEREDQSRKQISALLHGPILGRLSACVMALNFTSSSEDAEEHVRRVTARRVMAHLELIQEDLVQLAKPRFWEGESDSLTMMSARSESPRILLVDDDELVRLTLRSGLERSNYSVTEAASAVEAIAAATGGVDLLIIDARIPGDSLTASIPAIRVAAQSDHLPVIVMSGSDVESAVLVEAGAAYLPKPIDLAVLLSAVELASRP
jgi:CheY-like chemotaxis protein